MRALPAIAYLLCIQILLLASAEVLLIVLPPLSLIDENLVRHFAFYEGGSSVHLQCQQGPADVMVCLAMLTSWRNQCIWRTASHCTTVQGAQQQYLFLQVLVWVQLVNLLLVCCPDLFLASSAGHSQDVIESTCSAQRSCVVHGYAAGLRHNAHKCCW